MQCCHRHALYWYAAFYVLYQIWNPCRQIALLKFVYLRIGTQLFKRFRLQQLPDHPKTRPPLQSLLGGGCTRPSEQMSATLGTDGEEATGSPLDGDEAISSSLDSFPSSLLEEVLVNLDAWSVCHCALVSRAFRKVRGQRFGLSVLSSLGRDLLEALYCPSMFRKCALSFTRHLISRCSRYCRTG